MHDGLYTSSLVPPPVKRKESVSIAQSKAKPFKYSVSKKSEKYIQKAYVKMLKGTNSRQENDSKNDC